MFEEKQKKGENSGQKEGRDETCTSVTSVAVFPVSFHGEPISSAGSRPRGKALQVTERAINPPAAKR